MNLQFLTVFTVFYQTTFQQKLHIHTSARSPITGHIRGKKRQPCQCLCLSFEPILVSEPMLYVLITAVPRAQTFSSPALLQNFFLILQFPFNLFSLWLWLLTSFPNKLSEDKPHAISGEARNKKLHSISLSKTFFINFLFSYPRKCFLYDNPDIQ